MSTIEQAEQAYAQILLAEISDAEEVEQAAKHPGLLLQHVHCVDNTSGDEFEFFFTDEQLRRWSELRHASFEPQDGEIDLPWYAEPTQDTAIRRDPGDEALDIGWAWQGDLFDWWLFGPARSIILKGRQIGITWCAAGLALWFLLFKPGTKVLIQSKTEDDAASVVDHIWEMYLSLRERKPHLLNGSRPLKPSNPDRFRPHLDIEVEHTIVDPKTGQKSIKVSYVTAMSSTAGSGHGQTAALVILDEYSRHPYAREAWKAVTPAQSRRRKGTREQAGRTIVISTANGISTEDGGGNFYHRLWAGVLRFRLQRLFLRWDRDPTRDEEWYAENAASMEDEDRAEQYPRTPREAFILTGRPYFHVGKLALYEDKITPVLMRGHFETPHSPLRGEWVPAAPRDPYEIKVFALPRPGIKYAIGADVATAKGTDFSAAYGIDLSQMELAFELHGRMDADEYAKQLHFLGKWFNTARIAVENQGGYGIAPILFLRDGNEGRRPYPNLYRHDQENHVDDPQMSVYGMPMNAKTRDPLVQYAQQTIREARLATLPSGFLEEARTFVRKDTGTSPRAEDGCHDDRVMAFCITLWLYRLYGYHAPRSLLKRERKTARATGIDPETGEVDDDVRYGSVVTLDAA